MIIYVVIDTDCESGGTVAGAFFDKHPAIDLARKLVDEKQALVDEFNAGCEDDEMKLLDWKRRDHHLHVATWGTGMDYITVERLEVKG